MCSPGLRNPWECGSTASREKSWTTERKKYIYNRPNNKKLWEIQMGPQNADFGPQSWIKPGSLASALDPIHSGLLSQQLKCQISQKIFTSWSLVLVQQNCFLCPGAAWVLNYMSIVGWNTWSTESLLTKTWRQKNSLVPGPNSSFQTICKN